jgi:hypothetical protein
MRVRAALAFVVVPSVFAVAAAAADDKEKSNLERFKQLAGDWVGKETQGHEPGAEVHMNYKVTSAGSAIVETMFPGMPHEMVTVIHKDGDGLILTHYCAMGNQPHMRAPTTSEGNSVAFKFTGASNMKSDKDPHMHDATFTFIDNDTLKEEWTSYNDGKPAGKVVFELKRKK